MNQRIRASWRGICLSAIAAITFFANCFQAAADQTIHWQSDNQTLSELSGELNTLYGGLVELLEEGQQVTTENFINDEQLPVVQVAKKRELFFGSYFPPNLNAYLCLLNPKLCKVVQSNSDEITYKWINQPDDSILLPIMNFEKVIVPKPFQKRKNDTIKSIVVVDRDGCESLDARCKRYLKALNRTREGFMNPGFEGKILVPTATYRANIELEPSESRNTTGFMLPAVPEFSQDLGWLNQLQQQQLPAARLHANSADLGPSDPLGDRAKIRSLVNFPEALEVQGNSTVAVFDRQVFIEHCDFHSRVKFIPVDDSGSAIIFGREGAVKTGGNQAHAVECNSPIQGKAKRGRDHGTHIVGILGSRTLGIDNESNLLRRFVHAFQIPKEQQTPSSQVTSSLSKTISESIPDVGPNVMNMSISYNFKTSEQQGFDPVSQIIRDLEEEDILFVAAAGNKPDGQPGERFIGNCDIRPACIDANNVISVVALDLDQQSPRVLNSSNRGSVFDIAAPGANIESTTFSHTKGIMTGTSQAVPLVSVAASLLMAERTMFAWQARHRLMYSAALFSSLESDVFSGRLDIAAALELSNAKVTHTSPTLPSALKGKILTSNHRKIEFLDFDLDETFDVHPRDIRRLHSLPNEDYAMLFFVDQKSGRKLKRRRVLLGDNKGLFQLRIKTPLGLRNKVREVPVSSIVDYIAAF